MIFTGKTGPTRSVFRARTTAALWGAALLFSLLPLDPAHAQRDPLRGLDAYIEGARADWRVPALAVAIVKDDSIVYLEGFGTLEAGSARPVDGNTIFAIGSSSKAFTAAALGMLVDDGLLEWDDPATKHLPDLQLWDPHVTREITVRDLLTHRAGIARGEFIWYATDHDRDEILRRVRYLEPEWGFRSRFGYQNIMYLAAGQVVPTIAGGSWDDFVRARILAPLGMTRSSTTVRALDGVPNVASPHVLVDGEAVPVPYRRIDNIAPAGSINASARDVAQWVRLHLGEGSYEGRRLLEEETLAELHTPQTIIREGQRPLPGLEANFQAYGLGWFLRDYRGRKIIHHGGNIDGMTALVAMLPEEELGLVVLTAMNGSPLPQALMYHVFDAYLGAPHRDWSGLIKARRDSLAAARADRGDDAERVPGTTPALELARYAGTYDSPMNGEAVVSLEDGALVLRRSGAWTADLEHWHYDTFRAHWRSPGIAAVAGRMPVSFRLDATGEVVEMEVQGIGTFDRIEEPSG